MTNHHRPHDDTRAARADALVMFGLTGDLGEKKLFPALGELLRAGDLDVPLVSVSRRGLDADEVRDRIAATFDADDGTDESVDVRALVDRLDVRVVRGGVDEDATWDELAGHLDGCSLPVVYAALPPSLFGTLAGRVASSDLPDATRLVVEKPLGEDEASARRLWADITSGLDPEQVFVVDHFLAKAAIENLLTVRTCNAVIANNLRPGLVQHIDVMMHETGGVDGRGSFYESVGAVRDVVQNHVLQLLALATMDAPDGDDDEAYLAARQDLLDAVAPVDPANVVLGQYDGYQDLDDVADDSDVETFASMEVTIDRDPWRGVPVRLVTGKRLHEQRTAVVFTVRSDVTSGPRASCGRLVFEVSPSPCIRIDLEVLDGDGHGTRTITLAGRPDAEHGGLGDYATMLHGAMHGERRHFATIDGILAGWRIVDPIARDRPAVRRYEPGSPGPS